MSQARITLRPPPNVEFVEGYPGIPAGPERPHAEVRGTIELRLPAQGTKTKWVRVELKKVETLPGGGQNNTFYDFVGQSPVKVWEADGSEWALLRTTDFPFAIRIPESVPPSISLDRGAGIKYELTATICSKGKSKFFFFKNKDAINSTTHPIIIDKHELHSTWPVYSQPDSRHIIEDMLVLTVERAGTCFGPGDRVRVVVSFKNDGIPAASLRAFEFLLKETIIFRGGPQMSGKKAAPQVQVIPIGEQKIPVNSTIYQGQSHRAELGCFIPQTHTNTSISSARHLDISYCILVKAVLATGKPLMMELPVTVSNWPRNMSIEAVRRIGPSPALSLIHPPIDPQPMAKTLGIAHSNAQSQYSKQPTYNTAPSRVGLYEENLPQKVDRPNPFATQTTSSIGDPITGPRPGFDEFGATASARNEVIRRPGPVNATQSRRLTLVNAESDPEPDSPPTVRAPSPKKFMSAYEEKKLMRATMDDEAGSSGNAQTSPVLVSSQGSNTSPRRAAWPSAEDEKMRLYDNAKQQALKTQAFMSGGIGPVSPGIASGRPVSPPEANLSSQSDSPPTKKSNTPWPTAEEEKLKLYNAAQNAARRTQAQGMAEYAGGSRNSGGSPPATQTTFSERPTSSQGSGQAGAAYPAPFAQASAVKSAGAQLYQDAMASVSRNQPSQSSTYPAQQSMPQRPGAKKTFPSAEEEKAAMRYYEAKRAVDRHQQHGEDDDMDDPQDSSPAEGPIAYDDLYPNAPGVQPPQASPPVIQGPSMINNALSEKERLRQKYEAEDAALAAGVNGLASPPPPSPPARATGSSASPPGYGSSPPPSRSQPRPPADFGGPRHLTAAEEKARLRAQMEAEEAMVNGNVNSPAPPNMSLSRSASSSRAAYIPPTNFSALPPPPPLAPRPPAEYIQQTQEEDARSQVEHGSYSHIPAAAEANGASSGLEFGLPFRPFSPLDLGINFEQINKTPNLRGGDIAPPPPLPPKLPIPSQ